MENCKNQFAKDYSLFNVIDKQDELAMEVEEVAPLIVQARRKIRNLRSSEPGKFVITYRELQALFCFSRVIRFFFSLSVSVMLLSLTPSTGSWDVR